MIDLSGKWHVTLKGKGNYKKTEGDIWLPGILQMQGYGEPVSLETQFMSGLHNPFWFERKEYSYCKDGKIRVPFLAQPGLVYRDLAVYEREFVSEREQEYVLILEITRWKVKVFLDGQMVGEETSLFAPFEFKMGRVTAGKHSISIHVDNSYQYPYRPDGHGVSDALGATWNGIGGEISLLTSAEYTERLNERIEYSNEHPRHIEVKDGKFVVDGQYTYFRGTHFGGDYPHTGIPETGRDWWNRIMNIVKEWGFNFIRCHSYCPPEVCFQAADDAGVYLLVECGMWNVFNEENHMMDVLRKETERILRAFGHHPSFVLFSPSNEPSGDWYKVLRSWTDFARETDEKLGYGGRRLYTAESGWFYDVPPAEIEGTDFLYFHRSAYGPYPGGTIRNDRGWKGKDYSPSLEGSKLPVLCHEMGQWCSYPDFDIIDKFHGYMTSGEFEIFKACASERGVLHLNKDFVYCSGRNQLRLLKEEIEANCRTDHLYGYEYLDLHDYFGQGGALVGILDGFWDNKGYASPEELKEFVNDTVLLARLPKYVFKNNEHINAAVLVCHFGKNALKNAELLWQLTFSESGAIFAEGSVFKGSVPCGDNLKVGSVDADLRSIGKSCEMVLTLTLQENGKKVSENHWELTVFAKQEEQDFSASGVVFTKDINEAGESLSKGCTVVYEPFLSDLDFDCPAYSIKNSFWNNQMGPTWVRSLGLSIDEKHPGLADFPTGHTGGWQWEDILNRARMYNIDAGYHSIVRGIDEWNRNFPLSMIFEGKVGEGKLLMITADLSGSFEERPEAYVLRNSLYKYAVSKDFSPAQTIDINDITKHIMPLYKGWNIISEINVGNSSNRENIYNELSLNPNGGILLENLQFPFELEIVLKRAVTVTGLCYLAPQCDRDFLGCIKNYKVYGVSADGKRTVVADGTFDYAYDMQKTEAFSVKTDRLILEIQSVYAQGLCTRWYEDINGYHTETKEEGQYVQIAGLQVLYEEQFECEHNNERFWTGKGRSRHKEIES